MEAKEVIELVKDLEKGKNDDSHVLKILQTLDKEVVATEKLLRETKVGVEVNKFKKSSNVEISKLVRKMINSWKDAINRSKKIKLQQAQANNTNGSGGSGSGAHNSGSTVDSNVSGGSGASDVSPDGNVSGSSDTRKQMKYVSTVPRNAKNDGVDTNIYNHKLRDMVIKAFYDALAKGSEHPPKSILATCKSIEEEMNKAYDCDSNEKSYKERYRVIYSNIISKNHQDLKHKINNGDITAVFLANCDTKELAPEHLKQKMEEITRQNLFNAQGATIERSVTDRFTCGKCKEKKVSYYQLQTRSADEPLTTFCTCEACGNRWKFS
ncbi:hypothetical protein Kpol_1026p15 [Vanderwaltozyma polyspora DSM 70294]|uniref:Transcription elongation factor n=1 Tax=Vanderwaltozyma polyspora (strain ATCC 22028 / DSM 70294 / BCRC 21397 / CBS 2163 / NBRC 10782 / NRRL Y-8283 / UCD 57-17) TaxID=436907 RepID=A7TNI5_VANPO|nr:uncharacterized protein Kpol_1026p15 [Vanderwaltozyma polyspora DSM 70294]EDO16168.1 hypothetical protein Kpol_1026p15 [Vanderwaltozyma polyspora DSM 70294]